MMRNLVASALLIVAGTGLVAVLGCGGGNTAPVNGRAKFKDGGDVSALAGHTVSFETEGDKMSGYGDIQADGTFKVTTFSPDDGALLGKHRLTVTPPSPPPDGPLPKPVIHAKYGNLETSGLTAEIKPGTNNVELELERAK